MLYTLSLIAAAALAAPAAPAAAAPDAVLPPEKPVVTSRYDVHYDAKRDQYCLKDRTAQPRTGTRIVPTECHSQSEWAKLGLTIERRS